MLKKIGIILGCIVGLILILAIVFLYANDTVEVTLSPIPSGGVVDESAYLVHSEENGNSVLTYALDTTHGLELHRVIISEGPPLGNDGVFVKHKSVLATSEETLAVVAGSDFHNGIIEIEMNGSVSPNASRYVKLLARGFIGVGFRIADHASAFECLYLRPENGVTDDEIRRNHAVQYVSPPDWNFSRFRKEAPEQYEASAPIAPGQWHNVRIEVEGEVAKLFIDDGSEPVLVVNDLKRGPDTRGEIGLWVGPGTNGFFRNLKITKFD